MQVSVVIPTFNRSRTILRALRSVLAEKGVPFEVLVVDDGSTDETRKLVETVSKADRRVRYLFQPNRGPAAARNRGIQEARAEFIAFLDSDDEWLPGKLKVQLAFFGARPDHLICQTEEIWIREGKRVNPMAKHKKHSGFIFEKLLERSIISPSQVCMRRKFFEEVGLFDETLPVCEDYDLWLRASARFPIGLIEKSYGIKYGGHADQQSRAYPVMDRFRIKALLKLLDSGLLSATQTKQAARELERKCLIVSRGARKRGKIEEAHFYESLLERCPAP